MGELLSDFAAGLKEAWEGELFGEALMNRLRVTLLDAAAHQRELAHIADVERLMGEALARALPQQDIETAKAAAQAKATSVAARFPDWRTFLDASIAALPQPLGRFRALALRAPDVRRDLAQLLVRHEELLIAYLSNCADGISAQHNLALRPIEQELRAHLADAE